MAMITCPECGKEISDKAAACPNCGVPINVQKEVEVHFIRQRKLKMASQDGAVYIGGQFVGDLCNGQEFSIFLLPGTYPVMIESYGPNGNRRVQNNIEIPSDVSRLDIITEIKWPTGTINIGDIQYS